MEMMFIPRMLLLSTLLSGAGVVHALGSVTPAPQSSRGNATEANARVSSPAHPEADSAPATAEQKPTMETAPLGNAATPTLTAEEVGLRFLKLVARLEHRDDLTLALVKEVTGLDFTMVSGTTKHFVSAGQLASNWIYVVGFIEQTPRVGTAVYLDFRNSNARFADITEVCGNDFNYWHNAFIAMGFDAVDMRAEIGLLETWRYYKNDLAFYIVPQNRVPGQVGPVCVRSISMLS